MERYIKFFWQDNCPKCEPAKEIFNTLIDRKIPVKQFDIGTVDGMTEAAFHEVLSTPTTIIVDSDENEVQSWRGEAPSIEDLEHNLNIMYK